jgi:hypothetical protein
VKSIDSTAGIMDAFATVFPKNLLFGEHE